MYETQLEQLGLTEGESKVFEALLKLGPSTVGPIVKKSGVAYSNVYDILNRLLDKGLVSFIMREKTKYFQAVEPTRIKDYLDKQEQELQKSKKTFEKLLPDLEKLKASVGKKEEVEIFIGKKGLKTAYENLLKGAKKNENAEFLYVYDPTYHEGVEDYYLKLWSYLRTTGVQWRGITNEGYRETKLGKSTPNFIDQRYVSIPLPANIDIFHDKLLIETWGEQPIGILIQSKEIADNFRRYFDAIWKKAKQ